jgi:sugar-specific transcriptional regulator TrmB
MGAFISVHKKVCDKYIKMDNQFTEEYLPFINRYEEKFEHKLNGFIERFPEISQKIFTRESMKKVNQMKREEIKNLLGEGVVPQNLGKKFLSKIDNELKMIKSM